MTAGVVRGAPWLFSARLDLGAFLGSAVLAWGLLAVGAWRGWLSEPAPEWLWIVAVLLVDVAHVYATAFRTYFDRVEWRRRPWLYAVVPVLAFGVGAALYSEGPPVFWRVLAYLAVFHFVRQQAGWVSLYRARGGEQGRVGWAVDFAAIYLATLYPLVYWHTHDRQFAWFTAGDFTRLPGWMEPALAVVYWLALVAYGVRVVLRGVTAGAWCPGKDVVVATTAICWYVGIVTFNSDYAFTVTNVLIHGIPYLVLIAWYRDRAERVRHERSVPGEVGRDGTGGGPPSPPGATAGIESGSVREAGHRRGGGWGRWVGLLAVVWGLAFAEELLWDCGVWHERPWLFGGAWSLDDWQPWLVPLLAVPQVTHYVLDGFIWRRRGNPELARAVAAPHRAG